jgi:hypothetical protein
MQSYIVFDLERLQRNSIAIGHLILPLQNAQFIFFLKKTLTLIKQEAIKSPDG